MKLLLFIALLSFIQCALGQTPGSASAPAALTLSFGPGAGINKSIRFYNGLSTDLSQPDVTVLDGFRQTDITVGKSSRTQYRQVAAQGNYVLLRHAINGLESFDYLLEATDSVQFTYAKGLPLATVPGKKERPYDYTLENWVKARFSKANYSPLARFFNPIYFYTPPKRVSTHLTLEQRTSRMLLLKRSIKQEAYAGASAILLAEDRLLDSLKEQQLLSTKPYTFYKDKVKNLRCILDLETDRLTNNQVQRILASYQRPTDGQPEVYHHQLLRAVADKYFTEKAPILDLKDGVNRDYRQVYTRLQVSAMFSEFDKEYLLAREVDRIGQAFSQADFLKFFAQFAHDAHDTTLVASLRAQYALEFEASRSATASVVLTDKRNVKLTLSDLLKRHAGSVVYVDFWASWCEPCREALPHSQRLREALKGKKVVFVYISIDKTLPPWRAASNQEQLADYSDNYLAVNYPAATFFKQHQLTSIPRYMVFDRQSKLVHARAPGAESTQVAGILASLAR